MALDSTTKNFLDDMRKSKAAGGAKGERVERKTVEKTDQVNSKDREKAEQPSPPAAKKIGDKWVQPVWDEDEFEWKFPGDVEKQEKKEEKAASKKASREFTNFGNKGNSDKKKSDDDEDDAPEEKAEAKQDKKADKSEKTKEKSEKTETRAARTSGKLTGVEALLDHFADIVADRVIAKLQDQA